MTKHITTDRRRLIEERLEFVDLITGLHQHFQGRSGVRYTPDGGWTHQWLYFDSLRNYLLLTCFDLLGQPADYKDFGAWLRASSTEGERKMAIQSLNSDAEFLENVAQIFDWYLEMYGNRKSIDRFIDEILPVDLRGELFASIWIREIDVAENRQLRVIEDISLKRRFLYEIRNAYTHSATNTGSAAGGLFDDSGTPIAIHGELKYGYQPIRWEDKKGIRLQYSVRRWPQLLKEIVCVGLDQVEPAAGSV
jgi:hypothetical protein